MSDIRQNFGIARVCFMVIVTILSSVIVVYRSTWMNFFVDTSSFPAFLIVANICVAMVICDDILNLDGGNQGYSGMLIVGVIVCLMKGMPVSIPLLMLGCGLMAVYQCFLRNFVSMINIFSTELTPKKPRESVKKESSSCDHDWGKLSGWNHGKATCCKCGAKADWHIDHKRDDIAYTNISSTSSSGIFIIIVVALIVAAVLR